MSHIIGTGTTARLPFTADAPKRAVYPESDDTANLLDAVGADLASDIASVHPYAEGVIRFYRARTILNRDGGSQRFGRAWYYLSRLRPHDLPPAVRRSFFELVYFMQEQTHRVEFEAAEFRARILEICDALDRFVDELDRG